MREPPNDPAIRDLARRILERPEFAMAGAVKEPGWDRWIREFFHWLGRLVDLRTASPAAYWMVFTVTLILAIALIAHIVYALAAALRAPAPPPRSIPSRATPNLAADAAALAERGRYLEAAHSLMIACFRALAEGSVIELRPDRSNRWIRAALHSSGLGGAVATEIDGLIARTERRWFGDRRNDSEIYFQWRSVFERLSSMAP